MNKIGPTGSLQPHLKVAMNDLLCVHEGERMQHLRRDALQAAAGEVWRLAGLAVVLLELVQVGAQQLSDDEQVLSVVKVIVQAQQVVLVRRVSTVQQPEKLDFVQALIEKVLAVFDDLHAHEHAGLQIVRLNRLAERCAAQVLCDLVTASHDGAHDDGEVFLLFKASAVVPVDDAQLKRVKRRLVASWLVRG